MELRYSRHAVEQMLLRNVTQEEVEAVLAAPRWSPPTSRNARYDRLVAGRRIGVVVAEEHDPPLVVTVFLVEGEPR